MYIEITRATIMRIESSTAAKILPLADANVSPLALKTEFSGSSSAVVGIDNRTLPRGIGRLAQYGSYAGPAVESSVSLDGMIGTEVVSRARFWPTTVARVKPELHPGVYNVCVLRRMITVGT